MQKITEEMNLQAGWYEEARKIKTVEECTAFITKLCTEYEHDYGTICHAMAAAAIAAAWAVNASPQGGITGFQAGAIMWEFVKHWNYKSNIVGLRMVDYDDMLYPQHEEKFTKKTITKRQMGLLEEEAKKSLANAKKGMVAPQVLAHWKKLAAGQPPFGYTVADDE